MKTLITLLIAVTLNAEFLQQDKKQHIAAGLITYAGCVVVGDILRKNDVTDAIDGDTCVLVTIGVAAGKEVFDHYSDSHIADFDDITATVAAPLLINFAWKF